MVITKFDPTTAVPLMIEFAGKVEVSVKSIAMSATLFLTQKRYRNLQKIEKGIYKTDRYFDF